MSGGTYSGLGNSSSGTLVYAGKSRIHRLVVWGTNFAAQVYDSATVAGIGSSNMIGNFTANAAEQPPVGSGGAEWNQATSVYVLDWPIANGIVVVGSNASVSYSVE